MDIFMPMATTDRHNKFVATLMNRIFNRVESGEVHALQEQCPLVYWGSKDLPKGFELVDVSDIKNTEHFLDNITEL
ncbi:MAG: hypothetical protein FWH48_00515, partial [Oscillospiraceae bacterium]|nr:hypothetical protein [Oscillospiraceae bacterium]